MILAPDLPPRAFAAGVGHRGVAVDVFEHFGELDAVGKVQEQSEDVGTADDRRRSPEPKAMASSTLWMTSAPSSFQSGSRVSTMCRRPGSRPGRLSNVLRPMTIALPIVSALKRLRSAEMCHGSFPSRPMTPFRARATMMLMGMLSMVEL